MADTPLISPLAALQQAITAGSATPTQIVRECAPKANGNANRNTYLHFEEAELFARAKTLEETYPDATSRPPLYGVPISLKDCFDLKGTVTTAGSRFYAQHNAVATEDSGMAQRLQSSGALITGKTHLHMLAYGITAQNRDFGDCLQPRDATLLTGGSSSGAVASVLEGSALAAIGTDTGGSVRVPAALCGLAGYRASHGLASPLGPFPQAWAGAAHLAPSFDTAGILLRDARDLPPLAHALFGIAPQPAWSKPKIGHVPASFLFDCDPDVLACYDAWLQKLLDSGAELEEFDPSSWERSREIFAPIQAHEAAAIHRGHFDEFEPSIAERLRWGASLTAPEIAALRIRHAGFRHDMAVLLSRFDLLVLPAAPVSRLIASEDQANARARILRYTTPFSLAGLPAVTLSGENIAAPFGTGIQIAAAQGEDGALLAFAASLAYSGPTTPAGDPT